MSPTFGGNRSEESPERLLFHLPNEVEIAILSNIYKEIANKIGFTFAPLGVPKLLKKYYTLDELNDKFSFIFNLVTDIVSEHVLAQNGKTDFQVSFSLNRIVELSNKLNAGQSKESLGLTDEEIFAITELQRFFLQIEGGLKSLLTIPDIVEFDHKPVDRNEFIKILKELDKELSNMRTEYEIIFNAQLFTNKRETNKLSVEEMGKVFHSQKEWSTLVFNAVNKIMESHSSVTFEELVLLCEVYGNQGDPVINLLIDKVQNNCLCYDSMIIFFKKMHAEQKEHMISDIIDKEGEFENKVSSGETEEKENRLYAAWMLYRESIELLKEERIEDALVGFNSLLSKENIFNSELPISERVILYTQQGTCFLSLSDDENDLTYENIKKSIDSFENALQLDPKNIDATLSLGYACLKLVDKIKFHESIYNDNNINIKNDSNESSLASELKKMSVGSNKVSTKIDELNGLIVDAFSKVYVCEGFKSAEEVQTLENILRVNVAREAMEILESRPKNLVMPSHWCIDMYFRSFESECVGGEIYEKSMKVVDMVESLEENCKAIDCGDKIFTKAFILRIQKRYQDSLDYLSSNICTGFSEGHKQDRECMLSSLKFSDFEIEGLCFNLFASYLYLTGNLKDCKIALERAIECDPKNLNSLLKFGLIQCDLGMLDQGMEYLYSLNENVSSINIGSPLYVDLHVHRAEILLDNNEIDSAIEDLESASFARKSYRNPNSNEQENQPLKESPLVSAQLATAKFRKDCQSESSFYLLSKAMENYSDSFELLLCYGDILAQRGDLGKAMGIFDQASKLEKQCPLPYIYAARALTTVKEYESAMIHLDKAFVTDPSFSVCYVERGQLFIHKRIPEKSLECFETAIQFSRYLPEIRDILLSKRLAEIQNFSHGSPPRSKSTGTDQVDLPK